MERDELGDLAQQLDGVAEQLRNRGALPQPTVSPTIAKFAAR